MFSTYFFSLKQAVLQADANEINYEKANSIYDFTVKDTYGRNVSLEKYRGQVVLVVNIASQFDISRRNFDQLNELKTKYHERGEKFWEFFS